VNSVLAPLLAGIARTMSAPAYLQAQDEALPLAAAQYELLQAEACEQDDPALRMEALGLVALLAQADAEDWLLDRALDEPGAEAAEHARALLYQLTVSRNLRRSGHMPEEQLAAYQEKLRRLAAEARFLQRK
jgi:hypothetical protein